MQPRRAGLRDGHLGPRWPSSAGMHRLLPALQIHQYYVLLSSKDLHQVLRRVRAERSRDAWRARLSALQGCGMRSEGATHTRPSPPRVRLLRPGQKVPFPLREYHSCTRHCPQMRLLTWLIARCRCTTLQGWTTCTRLRTFDSCAATRSATCFRTARFRCLLTDKLNCTPGFVVLWLALGLPANLDRMSAQSVSPATAQTR
jgi:hypothetical protein